MKLLVTLELEVADIPEEHRSDIVDNLWDDDADDNSVDFDTSTMTHNDIREAVGTFFEGLDSYEMQTEAWAGSGIYCYFKDFNIVGVSKV